MICACTVDLNWKLYNYYAVLHFFLEMNNSITLLSDWEGLNSRKENWYDQCKMHCCPAPRFIAP